MDIIFITMIMVITMSSNMAIMQTADADLYVVYTQTTKYYTYMCRLTRHGRYIPDIEYCIITMAISVMQWISNCTNKTAIWQTEKCNQINSTCHLGNLLNVNINIYQVKPTTSEAPSNLEIPSYLYRIIKELGLLISQPLMQYCSQISNWKVGCRHCFEFTRDTHTPLANQL